MNELDRREEPGPLDVAVSGLPVILDSPIYIYLLVIRPGASAQNIDILSGTHKGTGIFKIRANIGFHFKDCHKNIHKNCYKNIHKNIKCLKYHKKSGLSFERSFYTYF